MTSSLPLEDKCLILSKICVLSENQIYKLKEKRNAKTQRHFRYTQETTPKSVTTNQPNTPYTTNNSTASSTLSYRFVSSILHV